MRAIGDERGLLAGWAVKTAVSLACVGVVLFDGGAIVVNGVGLDSTADDIANALATRIAAEHTRLSAAELEASATKLAGNAGARLIRAEVNLEGVLHVRIKRRARTLVVGRIDALRKWARAVATATATTQPS